jgi:dTDP-4-dehydrorhamnose 3,5-epimerase
MKLQVYPLSLSGVLIRSARTTDARGFFAETYVKKDFGICTDFVQDNQSFSLSAGTVRGLRF